ncbi:MAG: epoxyqueuosine reductase QueH [Patescibacteria group bacterium]
MKLLFHICCAPCGGYLAKEFFKNFKITLFFYNPNIWPKEEYKKRLSEVKRFSRKEKIKLIEGDYENEKWFELVKGYEKEKEGGERCKICFKMRLEKTAEKAKELGIENFSTSLAISPYKNLSLIKEIGEKIAKKFDLNFIIFNEEEKKSLWRKAREFSYRENFYHQKYCGCLFSFKDRLAR